MGNLIDMSGISTAVQAEAFEAATLAVGKRFCSNGAAGITKTKEDEWVKELTTEQLTTRLEQAVTDALKYPNMSDVPHEVRGELTQNFTLLHHRLYYDLLGCIAARDKFRKDLVNAYLELAPKYRVTIDQWRYEYSEMKYDYAAVKHDVHNALVEYNVFLCNFSDRDYECTNEYLMGNEKFEPTAAGVISHAFRSARTLGRN